MSDLKCCDAQEIDMVSSEPNDDGTVELTVRCTACSQEWTMHRAYPKSVSFDGPPHDNESDLPVGVSENKLIGKMTFVAEPEFKTDADREIYRWFIATRDAVVKEPGDG